MEKTVLTLGKRIAQTILAASVVAPFCAGAALAQQAAPGKPAPAKQEQAAQPDPAAKPQGSSFAPLKWIMKKVDFATDSDAPKPDFIEKTRPPAEDMKYIGIGEKRPERALKPKSQADAKAAEAALANKAAEYGNLAATKPNLPPPPTLPPQVLEAQQKVAAEKAARAKLGTPVAPAAKPQ